MRFSTCNATNTFSTNRVKMINISVCHRNRKNWYIENFELNTKISQSPKWKWEKFEMRDQNNPIVVVSGKCHWMAVFLWLQSMVVCKYFPSHSFCSWVFLFLRLVLFYTLCFHSLLLPPIPIQKEKIRFLHCVSKWLDIFYLHDKPVICRIA